MRRCDTLPTVGIAHVMIAHRGETIEAAQRVLVLIGGKLHDIPRTSLQAPPIER